MTTGTDGVARARRALRTDACWNHNTHYHRLVPRVAPPPWRSVLDVGCGEGLLTRRLAPFAERVTGIDTDPGMVAAAQAAAPANATYVQGDVLTTDVDGGHDLVTCVAALHHLDLRAGLERLRDLTAPGGTVLVVGLARASTARELLWSAVGVPAALVARRRRGEWEPGAPLADASTTYGDVRAVAADVLPGARFDLRLYWRYTLVWRRPPGLSG